jgi:hypothetical protein
MNLPVAWGKLLQSSPLSSLFVICFKIDQRSWNVFLHDSELVATDFENTVIVLQVQLTCTVITLH